MTPWYLDTRMLDAGDARRIRINADPDRAAEMIRAIDTASTGNPRHADLSGDLSAAADRLGVNVADLVALRRKAGIAPSHRTPSLFARIATRLARKG